MYVHVGGRVRVSCELDYVGGVSSESSSVQYLQ